MIGITTARLRNATLFLTMTFASIAMAVVSYWSLAPYRVVYQQNPGLSLTGKPIYAGSTMMYTSDWCKSTDNHSAIVSREFVDGLRYQAPSVSEYYPKGCYVISSVIEVPRIPPGMYRLHVSVEYHVNPLRIQRYDFWSVPFQVELRESDIGNLLRWLRNPSTRRE